MTRVWGIHLLRPGLDFASGQTIALERPGVGDLRRIGEDREELKRILAVAYPTTSDDTIKQWAGTLIRFAFTASAGDLLVHPNPTRRTLSVGRLVGDYYWTDGEPVDQHCRKVDWLRTGIPRGRLGDVAQNAAAGPAAFFTIKRGVEEFEALAAQSVP